jgi:hypothetical protein
LLFVVSELSWLLFVVSELSWLLFMDMVIALLIKWCLVWWSVDTGVPIFVKGGLNCRYGLFFVARSMGVSTSHEWGDCLVKGVPAPGHVAGGSEHLVVPPWSVLAFAA